MTSAPLHILGIIPARAGSKRLPRKNVLPLGGKPLVAHAIDTALAAGCLDVVALSSDDAEVLALGRRYERLEVIERPAALATDTSPAIDYVRHALEVLEARAGTHPFDAVVILQPSSPLTLPEDVRETVALLERTDADSAVSVMKLDHAIHPAKLKLLDGDRLLPYLEDERGRMAAHELPTVYVRNCAVYATRRRAIDTGRIVTDDSRAYVMPRDRSVDINDDVDLALAEVLFARARG